jgi:hypothetical protein
MRPYERTPTIESVHILVKSTECDETGWSWAETGGLVKGVEMRFVVDVQPFGAAGFRQFDRHFDKFGSDALMLEIAVYGGVEQKDVHIAIPEQANEAGKSVAMPRRNPAERARANIGVQSPVWTPGQAVPRSSFSSSLLTGSLIE